MTDSPKIIGPWTFPACIFAVVLAVIVGTGINRASDKIKTAPAQCAVGCQCCRCDHSHKCKAASKVMQATEAERQVRR